LVFFKQNNEFLTFGAAAMDVFFNTGSTLDKQQMTGIVGIISLCKKTPNTSLCLI